MHPFSFYTAKYAITNTILQSIILAFLSSGLHDVIEQYFSQNHAAFWSTYVLLFPQEPYNVHNTLVLCTIYIFLWQNYFHFCIFDLKIQYFMLF